ncbi:hypothetical protein BdWA1_000571 [Babesia duncani]|uniref:Uncharacterized protein n=1 Tax=Babesia duncani TaxID=323732 RepID=A0AAD9PMP1_9APIC|nr:hypothetical protein BdWA1_000571 [Babesia duncani]
MTGHQGDVYFEYSFSTSNIPNFEVLQIYSFKFNGEEYAFKSNKEFIYRIRLENVIVYACKDGEQCFKPWLLHLVGFYYDDSSDEDVNLIRYNYFFKRDGNGTWKSHTFTQSITVKSGSRDTFIYNKIESKPDQEKDEKNEYISKLKASGFSPACGYELRVPANSTGYEIDPDKLALYLQGDKKHKYGSQDYVVTSFSSYYGTASKFEMTLKGKVTEQGGSSQEKTSIYHTDERSYDLIQNGPSTTQTISASSPSCQAKKAEQAGESSGGSGSGGGKTKESEVSTKATQVSSGSTDSKASSASPGKSQSPSSSEGSIGSGASSSSHGNAEKGSEKSDPQETSKESAEQHSKVDSTYPSGVSDNSEPSAPSASTQEGGKAASTRHTQDSQRAPENSVETSNTKTGDSPTSSGSEVSPGGGETNPVEQSDSQATTKVTSTQDSGGTDLSSTTKAQSQSSSNLHLIVGGAVFGSAGLIGGGILIYKCMG